MFLAYQLDKQIRGSRFYQSIFYIPVVIAPAIIGLIAELILSPQQGLVSSLFADPRHGHVIDWLGNPSRSLWAVLVLACWRHASYVMIIYLAGLKALDPTLREAAAIDGASGTRTYFRVVLPALKPINIVLVVITVIEALRAFDIVYIINRGRNGLELLSVLITANIIGEASRIGYGSAIAVVLLTISHRPDRDLRVEQLPGGARVMTSAAVETGAAVETRAASRPRRRKRRTRPSRVALHAFLILTVLLWASPILWAIFTAMRPYSDTSERGYVSWPRTFNFTNF